MTKDDFAAAALLSDAQAARWYESVEQAMMEFSIVSPVRAAAFIAQIGHESGGFMYTREIWGPTAAQLRYEGRRDLGNVNPGDGKRYMGRGLIQITGRSNYGALRLALGVDVLEHPELVEQPALAARSAGWWWWANGCNAIADSGDFDGLSDAINFGRKTSKEGDANGYADRLRRYNVARAVLGA